MGYILYGTYVQVGISTTSLKYNKKHVKPLRTTKTLIATIHVLFNVFWFYSFAILVLRGGKCKFL